MVLTYGIALPLAHDCKKFLSNTGYSTTILAKLDYQFVYQVSLYDWQYGA